MTGRALITGASSGLGRDIARILHARGFGVILTARRGEKLRELADELGDGAEVIPCDLSDAGECMALYEKTRGRVNLLVNNAGFGLFGAFQDTDLEDELRLIRTNIEAPHMLMKLFLEDFMRQNEGRILNICSAAAFAPGPNMAAYYASKAYLLHLSEAVSEELRRLGSRVTITAFCPGPIRTEFDQNTRARFRIPYLKSETAAQRAVEAALSGAAVCTPGAVNKAGKLLARLMPDSIVRRVAYYLQSDQ